MCGISKQTVLAKLIQRAKLLLWDEAPMTHRFAVECIDRSLTCVRVIYHLVAKLLSLEVISDKYYL